MDFSFRESSMRMVEVGQYLYCKEKRRQNGIKQMQKWDVYGSSTVIRIDSS